MKLTGPAGTELRHILAIYIMCSCDLDLWPIFPKIGSRDPEFVLNVHAYLKICMSKIIILQKQDGGGRHLGFGKWL